MNTSHFHGLMTGMVFTLTTLSGDAQEIRFLLPIPSATVVQVEPSTVIEAPAVIQAQPKPADGAILVTPPVASESLFDYPEGLSMPPERLFAALGHVPGISVPMTPENCFDLAYACWIRGNPGDAVVMSRFGLLKRNDARLHLLLAVSLMQVNQPKQAEVAARDYQQARANNFNYGLFRANECINGPFRVRFEAVRKSQSELLVPRP